MNPTFDAFIRSWPFDPWLMPSLLLLAAGIYLRGWLVLHRRDAGRWPSRPVAAPSWRPDGVFLALASPLEPFASLLLQVHMVQHLLLMMVAPPLLWLGAPLFPLLRACRGRSARTGSPRCCAPHFCAGSFGDLTHPVTAWLLFIAATWFWHCRALYDLAFRSEGWHYLQHICFLGSALCSGIR